MDLSVLTPEQREEVLRRVVNEEGCPCGCSLTLAQCRINDSTCGISPPLVDQLVAEVAGAIESPAPPVTWPAAGADARGRAGSGPSNR